MARYSSILETIGNTPVVRINRLAPKGVNLYAKVEGQNYTMMSPYPGLDQPVSLQSWGHQLKLSDPDDPRIDQFISSLRQNQYTYPEVGARCAMGEVLRWRAEGRRRIPFRLYRDRYRRDCR